MPAEVIRLLTVNTGSSSVRLGLYGRDAAGRPRRHVHERHRLDGDDAAARLRAFIARHTPGGVSAVVHRVVHGGAELTQTCYVDRAVEAEIERLAPLAPLHNPRALEWMRAARAELGAAVPQIAVFDTAFFAALPAVAKHYAVPRSLAAAHGLRRYGFHGLAHQAMWQSWRRQRPDVPAGGRVISLQLGAGCSITAIDRGEPRDTSMGFSPLEGLVMATRSGDIDAGLVTYLQRAQGLTPEATERLLNEQSGLLGLSGAGADMAELLASDDAGARLAVDLYCYRARKYIGAYLAVLGGADALLFGGGVGENAAEVRARILEGMQWAGIALDPAHNAAAADGERCISAPGRAVEVWVMPADEANILAQEALALLPAPAATARR